MLPSILTFKTKLTSLKYALRLPQMCYSPPHEPVNNNDCQHDTNPFAGVSSPVPILLQYSLPIDFALGRQSALVHTLTPFAAVIGSITEFVDHHTSENVSLLRDVRSSLLGGRKEMVAHVVDIMENISPKWIQDLWRDQKASNTHPQAICERDQS